MAEILDTRQRYRSPTTGTESEQGCGPAAAENAIEVLVDVHEDGRVLEWLTLLESDYTGIVAEFTTGSATTLLNSSTDTELAAFSQTDHLSSTQRSNLGRTETWPAP